MVSSATGAAGSDVDTVDSSLSSIVPVASASARAACAGPDNATATVSWSSSIRSSTVPRETVCEVAPGVKVRLPLSVPVVKSAASVPSRGGFSTDSPCAAAQSTVTVWPLASDRVTVNSRSAPSVTVASATLSVGRGAGAVLPVPDSDQSPSPSSLVARTCTS